MPLWLPFYFWGTVLEPVCKSHITVREIDRVGPPLRGDRVLLCKHEAHDLTQLDIIQKELNVDRIWLVLRRPVRLIVEKVVGRNHLDVRIFNVDAARPTKCNSDRSVSGEKCPPYPFPESFVGST